MSGASVPPKEGWGRAALTMPNITSRFGELLAQRPPRSRDARSRRRFVLRSVAEPHDADRSYPVRDTEPLQELSLSEGDPEEPPTEPLVDGDEERDHRGHRGVDLPESDRPVLLTIEPERCLVSLRVPREVRSLIG